MDWYELVGYGVAILGLILGGIFWKKWSTGVTLLKEIGEAFTKTSLALEDKRITRDEAIELLSEWKDCMTLIFELFGRK